MAKIKKVSTVQDFIERNVDNFITDNTERYSIFQETAPSFITYYSKTAYASTHDENFESHNEAVGFESPSRYYRIENCPVYDLQTSDFEIDESDTGYKANITSTCYFIADTVKPNIDDLLVIPLHQGIRLFRVTNVTPDNYNNKPNYKVSIILTNMNIDDIEKQVASEKVVDYELIGKTNSPLIPKDWKITLDNIRFTFDDLYASFRKSYYSDVHTAFINRKNNLLDQYLNDFIGRNNLNKTYSNYRDSSIISPNVSDLTKLHIYKKLPYYALERNTHTYPDVRVNTEFGQNDFYEFNYFYQDKLNFANYIIMSETIECPCNTDDPNAIKEMLAQLGLSNIHFPYDLFLEEDHSNLTYNESFFKKYIDFIKEKENTTIRKKDLIREISELIPDIEPIYIHPEESGYSRAYYSSVFTLFALKDFFNYLSNVK